MPTGSLGHGLSTLKRSLSLSLSQAPNLHLLGLCLCINTVPARTGNPPSTLPGAVRGHSAAIANVGLGLGVSLTYTRAYSLQFELEEGDSVPDLSLHPEECILSAFNSSDMTRTYVITVEHHIHTAREAVRHASPPHATTREISALHCTSSAHEHQCAHGHWPRAVQAILYTPFCCICVCMCVCVCVCVCVCACVLPTFCQEVYFPVAMVLLLVLIQYAARCAVCMYFFCAVLRVTPG